MSYSGIIEQGGEVRETKLQHLQLIPEDRSMPYLSHLVKGENRLYSMRFLKTTNSFEVAGADGALEGKTYTTTNGINEIHLLNPDRIIQVEKVSSFSHERIVRISSGEELKINPRNDIQKLHAWNIDLYFWSKTTFSRRQLIARGSVNDFAKVDMPLLCSVMYLIYYWREWMYPVG